MRHALAVILLLVVGSAQAETIVYSDPGVVTGIGGLDIGGTLYNVDFETGVYSTHGGVEDFWINLSEATTAVVAINALFNVDHLANCEINNPFGDPFECPDTILQESYRVRFGDGGLAVVGDHFRDPFELLGPWQVSCADGCIAGGAITATAWSVVPLPAAVWLFGSGLGLLGWLRRRQTA